jgi:hypothetical protein
MGYLRICMQGVRKGMRKLCQDSRSAIRDSNQELNKYEVEMITVRRQRSEHVGRCTLNRKGVTLL